MTIVSRDLYTGALDTDITGRTPDGGGTAALQVGTYAQATGSSGIDLTALGAQPAIGSTVPRIYVVNGVPVPANQSVAVEGRFTAAVTNHRFGGVVRYNAAANTGYALVATYASPLVVDLNRYDGSLLAPYRIARVRIGTTPPSTSITYRVEVRAIGSVFYVLVDGVLRTIVEDATYTDGEPGLVLANGNTTASGSRAMLWEADDFPAVPAMPCGSSGPQAWWTQDGFNGAVVTSTHLRTPDGAGTCLTHGNWRNVPTDSFGNDPAAFHAIREPTAGLPAGTGQVARYYAPASTTDWRHAVVESLPVGFGNNYVVTALFARTAEFVADNSAWVNLLARHATNGETGYEFESIISYFDNAHWIQHVLWEVNNSAYADIATTGLQPFSGALNEVQKTQFCVEGDALCCYFNDKLIFNLSRTTYATGLPGLCLVDSHIDGSTGQMLGPGLAVLFWGASRTATGAPTCAGAVVKAPGCGESCEGGPDNPYPYGPPPIATLIGGIGVGDATDWNQVAIPQDAATGAHGHDLLSLAASALAAWVGDGGVWRPAGLDSDQLPYPETPFPPYFDPCRLLPEVVPGTVVPIPLTARIFGISQAPLSICGQIFNGTKDATGGWIPGDLAYAAARGLKLYTAQGGSSTLRHPTTGAWSLSHFVSGTVAKVGPILSTLQSYTTSGVYFGYSMADDIFGGHFWPPSGIPHNELASAVAQLKIQLPGIRLGVRARPSQFSFNLGFDFYAAQYISRHGSPNTFGATEYAIARGWNAYVFLDLNYVHGGNGSSGIPYIDGTLWSGAFECTSTEVVSYLTGMFNGALSVDGTAQWLAGSLGYKYEPVFLTRPGMVDALTTGRNALAALPPP